jgi:hypothetical protein
MDPLFDAFAGYPRWFVVLCLTIVAAAAIWLLAKLLKWGLYLLIGLVIVGGVTATVWLLTHPDAAVPARHGPPH